jgi:hypothetical protein
LRGVRLVFIGASISWGLGREKIVKKLYYLALFAKNKLMNDLTYIRRKGRQL